MGEAFEAMLPGSTTFSAGSISNRDGRFAGRTVTDLAALQRYRMITGDVA